MIKSPIVTSASPITLFLNMQVHDNRSTFNFRCVYKLIRLDILHISFKILMSKIIMVFQVFCSKMFQKSARASDHCGKSLNNEGCAQSQCETDVANYRPNSIVPVFRNILETIIF